MSKNKKTTNFDPYKLLELNSRRTCTLFQITQAYKKMALKWHPDKNLQQKEYAHQMFVQISQAYEFLKNKNKIDEEQDKRKQKAAAKARSKHENDLKKLARKKEDLWRIFKNKLKSVDRTRKQIDETELLYEKQKRLYEDFLRGKCHS